MKEYIERAAVMESILGLTIVDTAVAQYADAVCYHLQNLPAADVAEVRHGRWIVYGGGVFCSNCGVALKKGKIEPIGFHFCPNCGARMEKEDEHEAD